MFDTDIQLALQFLFAFGISLGVIGAIAWVVMKFSEFQRRPSGHVDEGRLGIVEDTQGETRLVLVRRDDVEHLLILGDSNDLVIDANIGRAVPSAPRDTIARPRHPMIAPPLAHSVPATDRLQNLAVLAESLFKDLERKWTAGFPSNRDQL